MIRKNFANKWSIRALKFGLALAIIAPLASCSSNSEEELVGNWVKLSPMDGAPRNEAVAATLDGAGYVGLGFDGDNKRLKDFWRYDIADNQWSKVADFDSIARNSAVAFGVGGKLYVGLGYGLDKDSKSVYPKDFWAYDPDGNTWTRVADFPGEGRVGAVAFSIDGIGYVGMGRYGQNKFKDFYAYDPDQDAWTVVASYGGDKASFGVAFVIGEAAYVCTGEGNGFVNDFYKFVPGDNKWYPLAKISNATPESFDDNYDVVRSKAVAFTSNGKGYIATGVKNSPLNDVWEYDPATDRWTEKTNFEGSPRQSAVAFTINNKGYVLTGVNSSFNFDDIWRFDADAVYNEYD